MEVFITDLGNNIQAQQLQNKLAKRFPGLNIHVDLNETRLPYPCGHTSIRVEGKEIHCEKIKSAILGAGFRCDVLEDKVCH